MKKNYYYNVTCNEIISVREEERKLSDPKKGHILIVNHYSTDGEKENKYTLCKMERDEATCLREECGEGWTYLGRFASIKSCLKGCSGRIKLSRLEKDYEAGEAVVEIARRMKNAWFWENNNTASYRAYYDRERTASAEWEEGGHHWYASFETRSSRKHIYTYRNYYKDNCRTNLTAIANSLKRIYNEIELLKRECVISD